MLNTHRCLPIFALGVALWSALTASAQAPEGVVRVITVDERGSPLPDVPFYLRRPGGDWALTRGRTGPDGVAEVELIDSLLDVPMHSSGPEIIAGIDAVLAVPREDLVMCSGRERHDIRLRVPKLGRLRVRVTVDDEPRRHRDSAVSVHRLRDRYVRCPQTGSCALRLATRDGAVFEGEPGLEVIVNAGPHSVFGTRFGALPRRVVFPPERSELGIAIELVRAPDWIFLARDAPRPSSAFDSPLPPPALRLEIPNDDDVSIDPSALRLSTDGGGSVQVLEIDARRIRDLGRARAVVIEDRLAGRFAGAPVTRFELADLERIGSSLCGWRAESTANFEVVGRIRAADEVLAASTILLVDRTAYGRLRVVSAACDANGRFALAYQRDPLRPGIAGTDSRHRPSATLLFVKERNVLAVRRLDIPTDDGRIAIGDWPVGRKPSQAVIVRCPSLRSWEEPQFFLDFEALRCLDDESRFRDMLARLGLSAPNLAGEGCLTAGRLELPERPHDVRLRVARGYFDSFLVDAFFAADPVTGEPAVLDLRDHFASLVVQDQNGRDVDAFVRASDLEIDDAHYEAAESGKVLTFLSTAPRVFVGAMACRGAFVAREDWDEPVRLEALPSRRVRLSESLQRLGAAHRIGLEIVNDGSFGGDAFEGADDLRPRRCATLQGAESVTLARSGEDFPIRIYLVRVFAFGGFLSPPNAAAVEIAHLALSEASTPSAEDLVIDASRDAVELALRALALHRADVEDGVDRTADRFFW